MTRDTNGRGFGRPLELPPTPLPVPADVPPGHLNLTLWVHIDADGHATYGGRLPADEVVLTLRFLADHIAALIPAPEQEPEQ